MARNPVGARHGRRCRRSRSAASSTPGVSCGRVAGASSRTGTPRAQHGGVPPRSPYDNLVHPRTVKKAVPTVEAEIDLVVEDPSSGFVGAVVRCEKDVVHLEDRFGKVRGYPLGPGFWVDGRPVVLVRPKQRRPSGPMRSASGSTYVTGARARVARAGRIYVEGKHDAELVEKVWGHDLRVEGVVVEPLHGVDDLPAIVRGVPARPGTTARRAGRPPGDGLQGVADRRADHRRARPRRRPPVHRHLAGGEAVGRRHHGVAGRCRRASRGRKASAGAGLGGRHRLRLGAADPRPRDSFTDLEPALLGRVEELIDFVTTD